MKKLPAKISRQLREAATWIINAEADQRKAAAAELDALHARMQMSSKDAAFLESKSFACGGIVTMVHDEVIVSDSEADKAFVENIKRQMTFAPTMEICTREIDPKWYTLNIDPNRKMAPSVVRGITCVVDQMMADGYGTAAKPGPAGLLAVAPMPDAWGRTK